MMTVDGNHRLRLALAAGRFRSAIEHCDRRRLPEWFADFPQGCCGDAAELLARYLSEEGFGRFRYVCGKRLAPGDDQPHTHAWLRQAELIVDITADQFPEIRDRVVVTTSREWYDPFEVEHDRDLDFELDDGHVASTLLPAYRSIREHIKGDFVHD